MVGRGKLTDTAWAQLRPLLPTNGRRGKQWRDHRQVINGILWRLRTGAPWRDVPARYGPWHTCYDRFVRWRRDGTWDRLLAHIQSVADAAHKIVWIVCIDGTSVRAHQHAAGAGAQRGADAGAAAREHAVAAAARRDPRVASGWIRAAPEAARSRHHERRNVGERCVNTLKQWRAIATRYEKRAANYRAAILVAALMPWLAT